MSKDSSSLKRNYLPILGAGLLLTGASYYLYKAMKSKKPAEPAPSSAPEPVPEQPKAYTDYEDDD